MNERQIQKYQFMVLAGFPKVSVAIPTYNNPTGLSKVLKNITSQTYTNLEILVSVNPSTNPFVNDTYRDILDDFCKVDPRIKTVYQEINIGGTQNFWFALHEVTGKYLMFAQDDDAWSMNFIEKLVDLLEINPNSSVAIGNVQRVDETGELFDYINMGNISILNALLDEKLSCAFSGVWRLDDIKKYCIPFVDVSMVAEALQAGGILHEPSVLYVKGLLHAKAKDQFYQDPLCYLKIYYNVLFVSLFSQYIPLEKKLWFPAIAVTNGIWMIRSYAAQVLFLLPVDHPIRKAVRRN